MKNRSIKTNKRPFQEPRKAKSVLEMSEQEMLAIGYRNPLVQKYNFQHTPEEKKKLKKLRSKAKISSPGMPKSRKSELEYNLTVHLKPTGKEGYKSTLTYKAKPSEVSYILNTLLSGETITKASYKGRPYQVAA